MSAPYWLDEARVRLALRNHRALLLLIATATQAPTERNLPDVRR